MARTLDQIKEVNSGPPKNVGLSSDSGVNCWDVNAKPSSGSAEGSWGGRRDPH